MNILLLVQAEQRAILDRLYEGISTHCNCDLRWLSCEDQTDLRGYFRREVDVHRYDRILFFLRFKQEIRQVSFIRTVPNLVILEHDAYQNYISCKYAGKFSKHYAKLPWARVISSGYMVSERLRKEGFDAIFVPKGYDQTALVDMRLERDIELGFIGSIKSGAYSERKALLTELAKFEDLVVTRTNSGEDYRTMLNRIRFFVSADVGMGEYMIKNFEAMACGCVLFAWDQGESENKALGFVDMANLVLYRSLEELRSKLGILRSDPALAVRIAAAGRALAEERYTFLNIGRLIVQALEEPLRERPAMGLLNRLRLRLGMK
ncbi:MULTISPECIES: glycosyltransferase [unclassified Pseudomonas]|uniref:glycosyltransferase family protein n=2 Tax=Pseudomonas TaxID=286 RepID=UPI000DFCE535|nr:MULTISPECIES: glycosyltransferase [unclassified Pseudomonas]NKQ11202.1 glycosyltransferase family 1 protein [Pseudomonas sp. SST3]